MSKKKKKQARYNQLIRHYFDGDGFDDGITRVDERTLSELVHALGVIPDGWDKDALVRLLRRLWSEAEIETRQYITAFFKEENRIYPSPRVKEPHMERTEKIGAILEGMETTKEEALLLHNAFADVRTKKITPEKMASKLFHIRFEQKRSSLEKAAEGHFDIDDRFEFNAVLHYRLFGEEFNKIHPLKTVPFTYERLEEGEFDLLVKAIEKAKTETITQKQAQLDTLLQTLDGAHTYLAPDTMVRAIRSAPPSDAIDSIPLDEETLQAIFERYVRIEALHQSDADIVVDILSSCTLPYRHIEHPYTLHLAFDKAELLQRIWQGKLLHIEEAMAREKADDEAGFFSALDNLVQACREHAKGLEFTDAELYETVYEHLLPKIGTSLQIPAKLTRTVLFHFNQSIQGAVLKRQRQELLGRTIRDFKNLFPLARELRRRLIFHVGPTNSGKTHDAMLALKAADTGYYLAPLRLLALEGYENLRDMGIAASLITGEEQLLDEEATHISSTIEMLNFDVDVDVCVIDEVQMIADKDRGWAWANAIIGAPAKTVMMTGSANALEAVKALAEYLGEPLEIIEHERKNPLELLRQATPAEHILPGTAVVAFSRREVLRLKQQLSRTYRVSVVYGNLSPEVRREEARRFREGETEVLVATDAIAMGLNLPIETILFYKADKFDGEQQRPLEPSEVHQIAGRAGRYGLHEKGFVGALQPEVLKMLHNIYPKPAKEIAIPFNVMANLEHIKLVGSILEESSLSEILHFFVKNMRFDGPFRAANLETMDEAAQIVDRYDLDLSTKFHLACAPVSTASPYIVLAFERYIRALEQHKPVAYIPPHAIGNHAQTMEELLDAEDRVKEISLYLWLSYRFGEYFIDSEKARSYRGTLNSFIENSLKQSHFIPRCRLCTKPLPLNSPYQICQSCFKRQYKGARGKESTQRTPEKKGRRRR